MKYLEEFSLIALLALFYFAGVYFAVAALVPVLALPAALVALIVGMIGYRILDARGNNKADLLLAVLFSCSDQLYCCWSYMVDNTIIGVLGG